MTNDTLRFKQLLTDLKPDILDLKPDKLVTPEKKRVQEQSQETLEPIPKFRQLLSDLNPDKWPTFEKKRVQEEPQETLEPVDVIPKWTAYLRYLSEKLSKLDLNSENDKDSLCKDLKETWEMLDGDKPHFNTDSLKAFYDSVANNINEIATNRLNMHIDHMRAQMPEPIQIKIEDDSADAPRPGPGFSL